MTESFVWFDGTRLKRETFQPETLRRLRKPKGFSTIELGVWIWEGATSILAFVCLFIVAHFTNQASALDRGMACGMFLGIFLSGSMFLSIGCLTSSLTRSQVTAAMMSLAVGVILLIVAYLANSQTIPATGEWQMVSVLFYFNLFKQMEDFTRGVVDTRTVIFYVSLTLFFLFLTLRVVESRRWK